VSVELKSPYPWFGGKRKAAAEIWSAFGSVQNYVEPFFGSGAVLLSRPDYNGQTETINDADGFVANFWRALKHDREAVTWWADYPVNESDLHARHGWLVNRRARLNWSLEDPDYYDAKIAGWWVWGIASWIGSGWCSGEGPWASNGANIADARKLPHLSGGHGINRKLPHLGDGGRAVNRPNQPLSEYLAALSDRVRNVRVACGDWSRVMGESVTVKHGLTAVFLDPPYLGEGRDMVYSTDCPNVAADVGRWCLENGNNPLLRIVLCGYEGEHNLSGWRVISWKASGGYGSQGQGQGRENSKRERLWLSPACQSESNELFPP